MTVSPGREPNGPWQMEVNGFQLPSVAGPPKYNVPQTANAGRASIGETCGCYCECGMRQDGGQHYGTRQCVPTSALLAILPTEEQ